MQKLVDLLVGENVVIHGGEDSVWSAFHTLTPSVPKISVRRLAWGVLEALAPWPKGNRQHANGFPVPGALSDNAASFTVVLLAS